MTNHKAMQMALDALDGISRIVDVNYNGQFTLTGAAIKINAQEAITALREALAQPDHIANAGKMIEWVDLTDDEIHAAINEPTEDLEVMMWRENYCRAVIAAFKEKNK